MTRVGTIFVAVLLLAGGGCRSTQKSSGGEKRDPLFGRYIPKQDLPIPDRRDPLLTAPASNPKRASKSEPFRNTMETTTAGLAGNVRVEDSGLSLGDRRAPGQPLKREAGESWDHIAAELHRLKARYHAPVRDDSGEYVMTATVQSATGAMKRYEATGVSAAAAAKQLLESIRDSEQ